MEPYEANPMLGLDQDTKMRRLVMEALRRSNKLQGRNGRGGGLPKHEREIVGDGNVDVGENNGG
jgi:hypothetical protein